MKWLAVFALLCGSIWATTGTPVDIPIGAIGPYADLTRNAVWGVAGNGGIENSWIVATLTPASETAVYVANNNPTSSHTFTIAFRVTGDQRITNYIAGGIAIQGKWQTVATAGGTTVASGVSVFTFDSPAAARLEIQITGTAAQAGSPDTADIYIVQTSYPLSALTAGLPQPNKAYFSLFQQPADGNGAQALLAVSDTIQTTDGGALNNYVTPTSSHGPQNNVYVIGPPFGLNLRIFNGEPFISPTRHILSRGILEFDYDLIIAQGVYVTGVSSASGSADPLTRDSILLGIEKVAGTLGNWTLFCSNTGTGVTRVDTGIPVVLGKRYITRIELNAGIATGTIGGSTVSCTTNLPTLPMSNYWACFGQATGLGGNDRCIFEYMYAENTSAL